MTGRTASAGRPSTSSAPQMRAVAGAGGHHVHDAAAMHDAASSGQIARPRRRRARCLRAGAGPFPGGACSRRGCEGPFPNGPAHPLPSFMSQVELQIAKHAKSRRRGGPWDENALRSLLFGCWAQSAAVATGPIRVDGFSHQAILDKLSPTILSSTICARRASSSSSCNCAAATTPRTMHCTPSSAS